MAGQPLLCRQQGPSLTIETDYRAYHTETLADVTQLVTHFQSGALQLFTLILPALFWDSFLLLRPELLGLVCLFW